MSNIPERFRVALDEAAYDPTPQQVHFLKRLTDLADSDELRSRVLDIQRRAYAIHPYPCIVRFSFLDFNASDHFIYERVLHLKDTPGAIFLDLGCFFGTDVRKAVLDGWPVVQVVGSDLHQDFLDLGKELFTASNVQPALLAGDIFDPSFVSPSSTSEPGDLSTLTSLTPLRGYVSALHASAFLHLFNAETKIRVLRIFLHLIRKEAGSTIFGSHRLRPAHEPSSDGQWQSRAEFEALVRGVLAESEGQWDIEVEVKQVERSGKRSDIVYFALVRQ